MQIEIDEGFLTLVAEDDAEAALLAPVAAALNKSDPTCPARLTDSVEGEPQKRILNGLLQISFQP